MAGPASIREQIMAELLRRAKRYLPTATRDPIRRQEKDLPRMVLADPSEARAQATFKKHQLALTVSVVLADVIDPAQETISHQANAHIAGILAAIITDDRTLGGLCDGIEYESSTINYPDAGEITFGIALTFTVLYSVALGDPFNRS